MINLLMTSEVIHHYASDEPVPEQYSEEVTLDNCSMNKFLASVEKRAFLIARQSVGNTDDALELVQESMLQLVKSYSDKSYQEWSPLFYRILKNKTTDYYRRNAVQNRFRVMIEWLRPKSEDTDNHADPYEYVAGPKSSTPTAEIESEQRLIKLQSIINALPKRQREAFQLRCWEGLSTLDTARVMGCSDGSVKTHYFRALKTIRSQLEGY